MNARSLKATCLVLFAVTVTEGYFLFSRAARSGSNVAAYLANPSAATAVHREGPALRSPSSGPADNRGEGKEAANRASQSQKQLTALRDMLSKGMVHVSAQLCDFDGKLTPQVCALFELTPTEKVALQSAVDAAKTRLDQLTQANSSARINEDGNAEIHVAPFSDDGRTVYDGMVAELNHTLGPDRGGLFEALMGENMEMTFDRFGAQDRTVVIKQTRLPNGDLGPVQVEDRKLMGPNKIISQSSFPTTSKLNKEYLQMQALVPGKS